MSMRDEFEAWVKNNWPAQSLERFNPLHGVTEGEYTGFTVQHCWDAWQASRAAIEVELAELRKDAERYRWLRANCMRATTLGVTDVAMSDKAIDAAISKEAQS